MKNIDLQLTVDEINLVLEALGNLPFARVYTLVAKIQQQASQQLSGDELPSDGAASQSAQ